MTWTSDEPKVSGFYWLRLRGRPPVVVDYTFYPDPDLSPCVYHTGREDWDHPRHERDLYAGALWCGPILPPVDVPDLPNPDAVARAVGTRCSEAAARKIAASFGIPPHMIGEPANQNYAAAKAGDRSGDLP